MVCPSPTNQVANKKPRFRVFLPLDKHTRAWGASFVEASRWEVPNIGLMVLVGVRWSFRPPIRTTFLWFLAAMSGSGGGVWASLRSVLADQAPSNVFLLVPAWGLEQIGFPMLGLFLPIDSAQKSWTVEVINESWVNIMACFLCLNHAFRKKKPWKDLRGKKAIFLHIPFLKN